jgi:hypothetical protein
MGHVACMGEVRNSYSISAGKAEGKTPFGRHRYRGRSMYGLNSSVSRQGAVSSPCEHSSESPGSIEGGGGIS